jgi:hypothetical protein
MILNKLMEWFDSYAASFRNGDPQLEDAVQLKYDHTRRVGVEMEVLCDSIGLDGEMRVLARIAALLHDVARFEQFKKYRTFSDKKSEDHAAMGVGIIWEHHLLNDLPFNQQEIVLGAIRYHNFARIPSGLTEDQTFVCRLLRDADKLDIYTIALDYYINPDPARHDTVQISMPEGETVTPEVCASVLSGQTIPYEDINTVADFKMIQLGWVFDLNFKYSIRCVKERGYIQDLQKFLPDTADVAKAIAAVEQYLEEQTS